MYNYYIKAIQNWKLFSPKPLSLKHSIFNLSSSYIRSFVKKIVKGIVFRHETMRPRRRFSVKCFLSIEYISIWISIELALFILLSFCAPKINLILKASYFRWRVNTESRVRTVLSFGELYLLIYPAIGWVFECGYWSLKASILGDHNY